jgi:hypothetical protein
MRVPQAPLVRINNAHNRLAGDFAQVYFPSQELSILSENYRTGHLDPWSRPSRYAPLIHYLCSITYCRLNYGAASLFHVFFQLLLFYGFFLLSFFVLGIKKHLLFGLSVANICLFLTPVGLSWFERGQFSLYVSLSFLLVIIGFFKRNIFFILLSAFFAFVKWTSFPYIFVVIVVFMFASHSKRDFVKHTILALVFSLTILLLLIWFPGENASFLKGLYDQERFFVPSGVSLSVLLPVHIAKFLPLALIFVGFLHVKINGDVLDRYVPYLTGVGILMLMYPTLAFEYGMVSLLCFVPLILYWGESPDIMTASWAHMGVRYSFFIFLFLAANSKLISELFDTGLAVLFVYIFTASVFLFVPLFDRRF